MSRPRIHWTVLLWQAVSGRRDFVSDSFVRFHRRAVRKARKQRMPASSWAARSIPPEREDQ